MLGRRSWKSAADLYLEGKLYSSVVKGPVLQLLNKELFLSLIFHFLLPYHIL